MNEHKILVPLAVLSILRKEESVRCVADRLGVTEAQVEKWKDIFVLAGSLALSELSRRLDQSSPSPSPAINEPATEFNALLTTMPPGT